MRIVVPLLCALVFVGPALVGPALATDAPAAGDEQVLSHKEWLRREQLPASFAVGTGDEPLALMLSSSEPTLRSTVAVGEQQGDLIARKVPNREMTMLAIESKLEKELKFDLFISPDGKRFLYTSTCALLPKASNYESWPYRIHSFAIGNVRVADKHTCD